MSFESSQSKPATTVAAEPRANWRAVPVWLLIMTLVMIYWGMLYFDRHGGWFSQEVYAPFRSEVEVAAYQPVTSGCNLARGKNTFDTVCALCHNTDGSGKPNQGPPLAGSEWVTGSPARLIRIPLYGLSGPITVAGQKLEFPAGMPPMGAALSDEDLGNLLCYMRQAFGNKASQITSDMVKAVRTQVGNRPQPFTPEELLQVPEK